MSEDLSRHRWEIDRLDGEILRMLNERAEHARAIGHLKSGPMYRPEREAQVLARLRDLNPGPMSGDTIARLFREIMSACLALERPQRIAYLGPAGTFSHAAASKQFGQSAELAPATSIDEVFRQVESGAADYAVAPVENSSEGAVGRTLDLLLQTPLRICGEVLVRVQQNLMSRSGTLDGVTRLYSHAQSLAQCQGWLNQHAPQLERQAVASNGEAARLASDDATACAVAGSAAAEQFGLIVVAANIEDVPNNTTRFLVLGTHDAGPSGRDKTSFVMSAPNRPGAMHELLAPLARHAVSMTRLESRPSRMGLWDYVFFVDIEGHQSDPKIATALNELAESAAALKIFGSYPIALI